MDEAIGRFAEDLLGRLHGPLTFRLVMQPIMALLIAAMDGIHDARDGKPPYFAALLSDPDHRRERIRDGWKSIGKLFVLAFAFDVIYQMIVFRSLHGGEALFMALLLAVVPYVLFRGAVDRLMRRRVV
jgi:hypothetical protein